VPVAAALAASLALTGAACAASERRLKAEKRSDSHLSLAQKLMEANRLPEALLQANMAIEESKKNADAWLTRGQIEFMRAEYKPAIDDFNEAMRRRDSFTEALSWRAWTYI